MLWTILVISLYQASTDQKKVPMHAHIFYNQGVVCSLHSLTHLISTAKCQDNLRTLEEHTCISIELKNLNSAPYL